jgi:starvation-inducible DNA-binding protein
VSGHEIIVRTCREVLPVSQKAGDEGTTTLITDRMGVHEKTAWMLRALTE